MLPRVSVAVITYNQAAFIGECLASVLAQDYPELEVVVADDGSTDGTRGVVEEVARGDARVKLLTGPNLGITGNANRGLHATTGELVVIIAGDDAMLPGRLARQASALMARPGHVAAVVATDVFDSDTGVTVRVHEVAPRGGTRDVTACELVAGGNRLAPGSSWMCRRSAIPGEGFDWRLPVASDALFFADVASHGKIVAIGEVLSRYRVHLQQATKSGFGPDVHLYFAMVESRYPRLAPCVRRGRATLLYEEGTQAVIAGDLATARARFRASFAHRRGARSAAWRTL
ncbi:MAG TPA: glycosyltransferase family 2 protein, partial [Gemmatimonadaceae bacterium]